MSQSKLERKKRLNLKKRKIRAYFLSIETKKKHKVEVDKVAEELYQDGMIYIQMKLPVEKLTNECNIQVKNLANGVYYMKIDTENESIIKRFIKK